jgi:hypothetical protein
MKVLILFMVFAFTTSAHSTLKPEVLNTTIEIEKINNMRESLANTLKIGDEINETTFKQVCMPVGLAIKDFNSKNIGVLRQVSLKNRNLNNIPNPIETEALLKFQRENDLISYFRESKDKISSGVYYFRRIQVQESCLACHGDKNKLPEFIKTKYKEDKAHSFKSGDLRGIYSYYFNDVQKEKNNE